MKKRAIFFLAINSPIFILIGAPLQSMAKGDKNESWQIDSQRCRTLSLRSDPQAGKGDNPAGDSGTRAAQASGVRAFLSWV